MVGSYWSLRPVALADRHLGAPGRAAVLGDRERDPGSWAVHAAGPLGVARGEEVDVGRLRVGRDRGLPVVEVRAQRPLSRPIRWQEPSSLRSSGRSRRWPVASASASRRFSVTSASSWASSAPPRPSSPSTPLSSRPLIPLRALRSRRLRRSPRARPLGFRRRNGWGGGRPPARLPGRCQALRSRNGAESLKSP